MTFEFEWTEQDYVDTQRTHVRRSMGWKLWFVYAIVILGIGGVIAVLWTGDQKLQQQFFPLEIVTGILTVLIILLRSGILYRAQFRKIPALKRRTRVQADEQGISFSSELSNSRTSWAAFEKWAETPTLFMLYSQPRLVHTVPKRAIPADELEHFREILSQRVRQWR